MRLVIARCLSKEPRNRWGSIGDVRWALDASPEPVYSPARGRPTALPAMGYGGPVRPPGAAGWT